jgi:hypothetical protein
MREVSAILSQDFPDHCESSVHTFLEPDQEENPVLGLLGYANPPERRRKTVAHFSIWKNMTNYFLLKLWL